MNHNHTPTLVIHGGAVFGPEDYREDRDGEYRAALSRALDAGYAALHGGKPALDAVERAIQVLEECGLFDAGRGAVFTSDGKNELDASIMDGRTRKAGAVAGVNRIKHPISAARKVMEDTWHVLLVGTGAEEFAEQMKLEMVDPKYFFNEERWRDHCALRDAQPKQASHETVGAVALDRDGNLAAGTSTGGLEMKHWGRVGDSPIIGAGTYADNQTCAVSCTGQGEFFIRNAIAYDVTALMKYRSLSVYEATAEVMRKLKDDGGIGGLIALTAQGDIAMPYVTEGMFRGYRKGSEQAIFIKNT